jgi:hypothetical protein
MFLIKIKKFDLVIVDRFFYIIKVIEFNYVIDIFTRVSKYIFIDVFLNIPIKHKEIINKGNERDYVYRNFNVILYKFFFKSLFVGKSNYKSVLFANSKRALYKIKDKLYVKKSSFF